MAIHTVLKIPEMLYCDVQVNTINTKALELEKRILVQVTVHFWGMRVFFLKSRENVQYMFESALCSGVASKSRLYAILSISKRV